MSVYKRGKKGTHWHYYLGEAGYDAFTIAALMRHGRIETTRRYVRATERNKRAAVQAPMIGSVVHKLLIWWLSTKP